MTIDEVEAQIQKLLQDNNLSISYELSFPQFQEIKDDVNLAIKVLQKNNMHITFILKPLQ